MGSGTGRKVERYLVEFVTEVYGVDVVAFEVGEHDDLWGRCIDWGVYLSGCDTYEEDHCEQESSRH